MIHSSRQIKNRADAYGGYGTESERLVETAPSARIVSDNPAAPIGNESIVLNDAAREQQRALPCRLPSPVPKCYPRRGARRASFPARILSPAFPPLTNGFDKFCDGFGQFLM